MAITASDVNKLRAMTGVGMMECKKALTETGGDFDAAVKLLRERGVAVAAKRAAKEANQGLIATKASADGKKMAIVEVNCETDFVARNADFAAFVDHVADTAVNNDGDVAELLAAELTDKIAAIGENMKIRRSEVYALEGNGVIKDYIHMGGKVGVMVELGFGKPETAANAKFVEAAKDICLHVAAAAPKYLNRADVDPAELEAEKDIYRKQLEGQNKPANIIEKIIEGKLGKFYSEVVLPDQLYVKDDSMSVAKFLSDVGKECGDAIVIRRFVRYQLGA